MNRILQHIVEANDSLSVERGREQRCIAQRTKLFKVAQIRATQRRQQEGFALLLDRIVKERSERCERELRADVGHFLQDLLEIEIAVKFTCDRVEGFRFFAEHCFVFERTERIFQHRVITSLRTVRGTHEKCSDLLAPLNKES